MGVIAFAKPAVEMPGNRPPAPTPPPPAELQQKGNWLKQAMKTNCYYREPGLSLSSLAEKLGIGPHELSRIINTALKKSFADFINEFRVRDITVKMQDPAYDHLTLLGIAFESGFNSKSNFNRAFKQVTGKTPIDYKKEAHFYNNGRTKHSATIISFRETTPKWSPEKLNRNYMFRNYLKIAWRNTLHNKVYSALNIAGLAAGMAVALLIGLWVYSQYAYDRFLPGYDQLYQVKLNFFLSGEIQTQSGSALPLIDELKKNYPEVKYASETDWGGPHSLIAGDKKLDPRGLTVGTDFLKMFPYPMVKGNINSVFADANSIILTESVAKALFGDEDPMDKVIRIDNQVNVRVTSVMKDVPANSTLQFSFLLPRSLIEQINPAEQKQRTIWRNYSYPEYVELQPGADVAAFESKIKNIIAKHDKLDKTEVVSYNPQKTGVCLHSLKMARRWMVLSPMCACLASSVYWYWLLPVSIL